MPLVSIIIPTYNSAKYIGPAIESVLVQTYRDYEIIVVDDGSIDNTAKVLRPYRDQITYIYQENKKQPAARNTGIAASKGEYLAFLDSDDVFLPQKLATQARLLDDNPGIGLVASGYQFIDGDGNVLEECYPWKISPLISLKTIFFSGLAPPTAILLRRSWLDAVGNFDPDLPGAEDMDLWYRLALEGCPMIWDTTVTSQYRVHDSNFSRSPEEHFNNIRVAVKKAFADPRLPDELLARRTELEANLDLLEASRLVAGGWIDDAGERVLRAVTTNPRLKNENGYGLAEMVIGLKSSVWGAARFPEFVTEVMADEIPALDHTMAVVEAKKRFYGAFDERQAAEVRRFWLEIARHDPHWLFNRGGWSILRQSCFGYQSPTSRGSDH